MAEFFKKTSVFKVFSKKRLILFCGIAVVLLLCLPLKPASAWTEWLNPATWLAAAIGGILKLILLIAKLALQLANWLLGKAIANPWKVSFTIPGAPPNNPIIDIGWTLLRDLTNMLFILGLAYIGLATALNLTTFDTKKAFFRLILIAVLINFTPVICGVVVDITNIVASFFLQGTDFNALLDVFNRQQAELSRNLSNFSMDNALVMLKALFVIAYGFISAFVITLYSSLFLARAPIIWLLVILSPLAFFTWIFGGKIADNAKKWWGLFLQWAGVVIPSAFFLYLSQQVLVRSKDLVSLPSSDLMGKFFSEMAPYLVALFFMIVGLIMSIRINAMGAGAVMSVSKTGLKKAGLAAGGLAKQGGRGIRNFVRSRREAQPKPGEEDYEKWAQGHKVSAGLRKAGRYMFGGESDEERARWEKPGGARAARVGARTFASLYTFGAPVWARRATRKVAAQAEESTKKDMAKAQEKYKGKTIATKQAAIKNAAPGFLGRIQRVGALKAAIEDGDPLEHLGLEDWETKRIMQDATKLDPSSMFTIRNVNPFLAAEVANELKFSDAVKKQAGIHIKDEDKEKYKQTVTEDDERVKVMSEDEKKKALLVDEEGKPVEMDGKKQYKVNYTYKDKEGNSQEMDPLTAKLIAEIRTDKMNTWNEDLANQIATSDIAHDFWNGAHVGKAAELFSTKFLSAFRKKMQELGPEHYEAHNPLLAKYFTSTPARTLGLDFGKLIGKAAVGKMEKEVADNEVKIGDLRTERQSAERAYDIQKMADIDRQIGELESKIKETKEKIEKAKRGEEAKKQPKPEERLGEEIRRPIRLRERRKFKPQPKPTQPDRTKQRESQKAGEITKPQTLKEFLKGKKEKKKK